MGGMYTNQMRSKKSEISFPEQGNNPICHVFVFYSDALFRKYSGLFRDILQFILILPNSLHQLAVLIQAFGILVLLLGLVSVFFWIVGSCWVLNALNTLNTGGANHLEGFDSRQTRCGTQCD